MVVEALLEGRLAPLMTPDCDLNGWVACGDILDDENNRHRADTLPRALALAVAQLAGRQGE